MYSNVAGSLIFRYSIKKVNGENDPVWSYKLELMLIEDNLWEVITNEEPPAIDTKATAAWIKKTVRRVQELVFQYRTASCYT